MAELKQENLDVAKEDFLTESEVRALISNELTNYTATMRVKKGLLQSGNFVAGSTGWKIDAQGNAEFRNLTIDAIQWTDVGDTGGLKPDDNATDGADWRTGQTGSVTNKFQGSFGGDGSDGALSISSGTTTVDLGNAATVVKNYTSISITSTGVLAFSNPNSNGTVIVLKSQGDVTITSTATRAIDLRLLGIDGGAGGVGTDVAGSDGGDSNNIIDTTLHAGAGGLVNSGGFGAGGAQITESSGLYSNLAVNVSATKFILLVPGAGAGGGGAGRGDGGGTGGSGGAGGRGAGAMLIECGGAYNFTETIDLSGETGTAGSDTNADGGAGGGGAGGMVLVMYNTLTADSGTYTVSGGSGGPTGGGGAGTSGDGGGGGGTTEAAGTNGTVGTGGAGGAGGAGAAGIAIRMTNDVFS